ncbi:MAG TPA: septal ring lytic transglycosylase RlpA family protein, partial [Candidatus Limnocylindria bacterium]|nr:septal ring lytic transglycosylase RlpA family protein [Candidatus Limnocylindria bacterium]
VEKMKNFMKNYSCPIPPALLFILLALSACARSYGDDAIKVTQPTEKVAETVKQKAQATEKREGSQDLVKDEVSVKKSVEGTPIIEQTGEASSYGRGFHGKATANGEKFDKNNLTAAHPTLPMGTKATVTNLDNGKSVDVTINDRGPYVKGRDIDVSEGAAKELDMTKSGIAPVKIEAEIPAGEKPASKGNASAPQKKAGQK